MKGAIHVEHAGELRRGEMYDCTRCDHWIIFGELATEADFAAWLALHARCPPLRFRGRLDDEGRIVADEVQGRAPAKPTGRTLDDLGPEELRGRAVDVLFIAKDGAQAKAAVAARELGRRLVERGVESAFVDWLCLDGEPLEALVAAPPPPAPVDDDEGLDPGHLEALDDEVPGHGLFDEFTADELHDEAEARA